MPKEAGKPRGRMSSYAFFVQTCREEHRKKHPGENLVFAEFSKKCSERWKEMQPKDKKRFEDMAEKDKQRFDQEMSTYQPSGGAGGGKGGKGVKRRRKDPNAPKRALSGFFFFCHEERQKLKSVCPNWRVGDIAKELGKRWEVCPNKAKYEAMAAKDKLRYEQAMADFKAGGGAASAGAKKPKAESQAATAAADDEEDDEDDEDDEGEESD